jgi:hypothetical protein
MPIMPKPKPKKRTKRTGVWNFRVLRDGERLSIREAYYDRAGSRRPEGLSGRVEIDGEDLEELRWKLGAMLTALSLPVLSKTPDHPRARQGRRFCLSD